MLEGDKEKKTYYLWGFSTLTSFLFDIRNTRSGSLADEYLMRLSLGRKKRNKDKRKGLFIELGGHLSIGSCKTLILYNKV